ncbi:atherin isoform X1 [Cydia splendana]|uniref:atherin isoform X1 n=1 Tax=Cydia splendana TaxID=1100963 RepID=UPI00300C3CA5
MSVRVDHRDRDRFSRHSSRASVDLAFPSSSARDHSFRSVHSARVPRATSDDLMVPVRTLRSASCRVAPGAPHRLRRHHSSAAECDRARRSRRHTLELPHSRGPSVRSRSPEPQPPPPEPEVPPEDAGKEARRRRVVAAVAASFFALAVASVLVVVVTLTHSSVLRAHNQTANTPGERAYDARRPPAPAWKSHPVVGGIALTPRYSPKPRLDNVRPAAAPPEEPEPDQPDADSDAPEAHAEALVRSLSPPTLRENSSASVSQGLAGLT